MISPWHLSLRQRQLFRFIDRRLRESGIAPTYGEMEAELGITSRSFVQQMLRALCRAGLIRVLPGRARAIEVVNRPAPKIFVVNFEQKLVPLSSGAIHHV